MWTTRNLLVLSVILQVVPFADADNTGLTGFSSPSVPPAPGRVVFRLDYLNNAAFAIREKALEPEPVPRSEAAAAPIGAAAPSPPPAAGLHWVPGDQHPTLEYQFSDQGRVHFHVSRSGAAATAVWGF